MNTIVQDVVDLLRNCGFEVHDERGAGHQFGVVGTLDSAALLIEAVLEIGSSATTETISRASAQPQHP